VSKLWVKINYAAVAILVKQLENSAHLLKDLLDRGVIESDINADICAKPDCPNRTNGRIEKNEYRT